MAYNFDHVPNGRTPGVLNKWTWYPKDVFPVGSRYGFPAPKPILDELRKALKSGCAGL